MTANRAWVLLPSGRRLDLFSPDPQAWTDDDLAVGLSRTYRWAGYSAWELPLSVAQHSLTVLAIRAAMPGPALTSSEALRELLHDAVEALMGGWDPITPLKPHLGRGFHALVRRLQAAVDRRYQLPPWSVEAHALHKKADRLAAASEAFHVAGWPREAIGRDLGMTLDPLQHDPLLAPEGMRPWEPWPPRLAAGLFLVRMGELRALASDP
jgi:5'-deoxynucleotidase YfbR-like HD superfamily hydrolase